MVLYRLNDETEVTDEIDEVYLVDLLIDEWDDEDELVEMVGQCYMPVEYIREQVQYLQIDEHEEQLDEATHLIVLPLMEVMVQQEQ